MDPKLFYCNQSNFTASPFDVVFNLNRVGVPPIMAAGEGVLPEQQIVDSIQVAMGHAHAKLFAALVINQILEVEKVLGKPITLDAEHQKRWDEVIATLKALK